MIVKFENRDSQNLEFGFRVLELVFEDALGCMRHLNWTSLSSCRNLEFGRRVLELVFEDALECMRHLNWTSLSSRRNSEFGR